MRMKFRRSILTVGMLVLSMTVPFANAWFSSGSYTHEKITDDAINAISGADYPDIHRFAEQLRDGSEIEDSHDILNDGIRGKLWAGDPKKWWEEIGQETGRKGVIPWYSEYNFGTAYEELGYMLHLLQDQDVPAHITYCAHGYSGYWMDDLEWYVWGPTHFGYETTTTPWTFTDSKGSNWCYWLDNAMDDDDEDNQSPDPDDETGGGATLIVDGPSDVYYVANTAWGTYGYGDYSLSFDPLPGKNEGKDYFDQYPKEAIGKEQLKKSYNKSFDEMKARSEQLPPLVPDDDTHGKPTLSRKIFGPNKPVDISFVVMENRKETVFVSILAGADPIKDTAGKVWDGGAEATHNLSEDKTVGALPWKDTISLSWKGDLGSDNKKLADGEHTVTIKVTDQDGNTSEERTLTVKYDKTKPRGTISVKVTP